jgi:hypothetical protein
MHLFWAETKPTKQQLFSRPGLLCHTTVNLMDAVVDDDKKPFDAEIAQDDDSQPDPEEHLMLDQGNGRIWLVKVCKSIITVVLELLAQNWRPPTRFQNSSWSDGQLSMLKMSN